MSLRSSAKHKGEAEPLLQNLGLLGQTPAPEMRDLLGGAGDPVGANTSAPADLLGGVEEAARPAQAAQVTDLLGSAAAVAVEADLLGDVSASATQADLLSGSAPSIATHSSDVSSLDPLLPGSCQAMPASTGLDMSNPLAGLTMDTSVTTPGAPASMESAGIPEGASFALAQDPASSTVQGAATAASHAALDSLAAEGSKKAKEDAFGFVGEEIMKAQSGRQV